METICLRAMEFRAEGDAGDGRTLDGYAATFGRATRISGWEGEFDEEIQAGAFRKTLRSRMPVLQFDHGRDARTGTVPIGSIETLAEDDQGLHVVARLYDNPVIEPIRQAIEGGSISGMSFRFAVAKERWTDAAGATVKPDDVARLLWEPDDRGPLKRTIIEVDPLYELGPVVFPAYESTSVGVRSLLAQLTPDEHKQMLRELARDLQNVTGRPIAEIGGGEAPPVNDRQRADHDALRLRGII
jgi:HK97 family phage prohead protease